MGDGVRGRGEINDCTIFKKQYLGGKNICTFFTRFGNSTTYNIIVNLLSVESLDKPLELLVNS